MRNNRILILSDLLDTMGGAERSLYILAHHLDKRGYEVSLACLRGGNVADKLSNEGFFVDDLNVKRIYSLPGIRKITKLVLDIRKNDPSVVVTFHKSSDYVGAIIAVLTKALVVSSRRDMGFNLSRRHVCFYRAVNGFFSSIITVSSAVRKAIIETQGGDPRKIIPVSNGIDVDAFIRSCDGLELPFQKTNANVVSLCCVANIRFIKGHKYLVEALAAIQNDFSLFHLYLVGSYDKNSGCYQEIVQLIEAHKLQERITFLGPLCTEEVSYFLKKMDIAILPSLSEGMSNALLEYMASGLPVVTTAVGGNPEVVIDGKTGFVVPAGESKTLASALFELIDDLQLRKEMGNAGFHRVNQYFSASRMTDCYEDIIKYVDLSRHCFYERNRRRWLVRLQKGKQWVKCAVATLLYYCGCVKLFNLFKQRFSKGRVTILCLHQVTADSNSNEFSISLTHELFAQFLHQLNVGDRIVPLKDAIEIVTDKTILKEDCFAITFDDCYKEFSDFILSECDKLSISYAVFLNTGPLDTGEPLLYDSLIALGTSTWRKIIDFSYFRGEKFILDSPEDVRNFVEKAFWRIVQESIPRQRQILKEISKYMGEKQKEDQNGILVWSDVLKMKKKGVTIGAHTVTHPLLTSLPDAICYKEILDSKKRLEAKLNNPVDFFAYPFGHADSFNQAIVNCVQACGFKFAFSLIDSSNLMKKNYLIGRKSVNAGMFTDSFGNFSKALLEVELSGLGNIVFGRWIGKRKMSERNR